MVQLYYTKITVVGAGRPQSFDFGRPAPSTAILPRFSGLFFSTFLSMLGLTYLTKNNEILHRWEIEVVPGALA